MVKKVLMTGASGFIGKNLLAHLNCEQVELTICVRRPVVDLPTWITQVVIPDLATTPLPAEILKDMDMVVHLAVPYQGEKSLMSAAAIAENVAKGISQSGVRNIVVRSSIAAQVAENFVDEARDFGKEKLRADQYFRDHLRSDQNLIIIRPPAIYGPGAKGPLSVLAKLVKKRLPLPFGNATAPRPYLSIGNVCDLIVRLMAAPDEQLAKLHNIPLVCHDLPLVSTRALVTYMGAEMGKPVRIVPMPVWVLRFMGRMTGKQALISGVLDVVPCSISSELETVLGWSPQETMPDSLAFLRKD